MLLSRRSVGAEVRSEEEMVSIEADKDGVQRTCKSLEEKNALFPHLGICCSTLQKHKILTHILV